MKGFWAKTIQNLEFKIFEVVLLLKSGVNEVFCTTDL
jgi:hypothetical protein